jgi:hypothetical protein
MAGWPLMIVSRTPVTEVTPDPSGDRWRRWWVTALIIMVLLAAGGMLVAKLLTPQTASPPPAFLRRAATPSSQSSLSAPPPLPSPSGAAPSEPSSPAVLPSGLLRMAGFIPSRGSGKFEYAPGWGKVLGRKGEVRRFRVAVERGSNENTAAVAAQVEQILGDPRSWVGDGNVRLQRVPGNVKASFTVYLATRDTAGRMCRLGGVNITVRGRPYTSCRATGKAIINLDRWRLSAAPYLAAKVPLTAYRQYVINHEVGHELGRHHQDCPKQGGPSPVMVQQTLSLRGCVPYSWPRRADRRFEGPPL